MTRLTSDDFDPEVMRLFDQYVHGQLDRRGFLSQAGRYAVGGATGASLLAALSPSFAATQVAPTDPRIKTSRVEYPSPNGYGAVNGYLVTPANPKGKLPAVLVVHENREVHDAGKNTRVLAGWPAFEEALKASKVRYQHFVYPGTEHGFNNDTTPRYDEAAAKLAWQRTVEFFKANLAG